MIRLREAHAVNRGTRTDNGQPVVVAVLDTGIDPNHPLFAGRLVAGYDFIGDDADPSEEGLPRINPAYGHGTHVAGIVAMIAPEAKIMPVRVLNRNGESELWRVQAAIIWAINNGADVLNLSFAFPNDVLPQNRKTLGRLFDYCGDGQEDEIGKTYPLGERRGIFVTGSGNAGNRTPVFPGAFKSSEIGGAGSSEMMTVAASTRYDRLAAFSTINHESSGGLEWVRFVAPGENIVSAMPGGGYAAWSGTSMSAPVVAGVAALVKAQYPAMSPEAIFEQVEDGGVEWECFVQSRGYSIDTTRVDALCALSPTPTTCTRPPDRSICPE